MGTLKKYRFRLAWQNYRVGDTIEPTGTVRDWLVTNGYIEPVPDPTPKPPVTDPTHEPSAPELPAPELPTQPASNQRKRHQRVSP